MKFIDPSQQFSNDFMLPVTAKKLKEQNSTILSLKILDVITISKLKSLELIFAKKSIPVLSRKFHSANFARKTTYLLPYLFV